MNYNNVAAEGSIIKLSKQVAKIVECEDCGHLMVNLDVEELGTGDLSILKKEGVRISNPETDKEICINCEFKKESFGHKLASWFETDNDDDTPFFTPSSSSDDDDDSGSPFGGFGGFGGGVFSGGGASRSF